MINPGNDPFLPPEALPASSELSGNIRFESPRGGGHVGFVHAAFPGQLDWLPQRLLHFFQREI
jgi:predicted alpha/beta-fold hydrolase